MPECPAACFQPTRPGQRAHVLQEYGLAEDDYFLVVGGLEERKAPDLVLDALARCPQARVAFAGSTLEFDIESERRARGLAPERARALGHVPDDVLVSLYGGARAVLVPSRHEGFGLPVIEAFACAAPVIAAAATSLPEVAGDAARLFEPDDAQSLADAMSLLLEDDDLCDLLVARGRERLDRYRPGVVQDAVGGLYAELGAA